MEVRKRIGETRNRIDETVKVKGVLVKGSTKSRRCRRENGG